MSQPGTRDAALELELAARIDPWLEHMRWRPDFARWREQRLWQERYQALAVREVVTRAGADLRERRVLDLGSGMGGFAVELARETGACVTASDFNPAYNEIARLRARRYGLDLPAVAAAGEALPLAAQSFDLITAWDVLEHVQDPRAFVAEGARLLKPGGLFFLTAINRFAFRDPHYHLPLINYMPRRAAEWIIARGGRGKGRSAFRDRQRLSEMHYYTFGEFSRLVQHAGFALQDVRGERVLAAARSGRRGALLQWASRAGVTSSLYRLYRAAMMGTFQIVLTRQ